LEAVGDRLFAEDSFHSGGNRSLDDCLVRIVPRAHRYDVERSIVKHTFVVVVPCINGENAAVFGKPRRVDVGECHELDTRGATVRAGVRAHISTVRFVIERAADSTTADDPSAQAHPIVSATNRSRFASYWDRRRVSQWP